MKSPALFAVATFAIVLSVSPAVQSASGMSAMQYYVGSWSCTGGPLAQPPVHAALTYTMDSGVLRQMINVPKQGKMRTAYISSSSQLYDSKTSRYLATALSNDGGWDVSSTTLSGNTERSTDLATKDGKLGHGTTVRVNNDMFTSTGYPTATATKPDFKATCRRS